MLDLLIGAEEAAKFTGLSRRTIYHLVEQDDIPYRRIGARLYFRRSELDIAFRAAPANSTERQFVNDNENMRENPAVLN